jgi:hypothetical protein
LISELAQANPPTQTIIGLSADPNRATAAMEADADSFIENPSIPSRDFKVLS